MFVIVLATTRRCAVAVLVSPERHRGDLECIVPQAHQDVWRGGRLDHGVPQARQTVGVAVFPNALYRRRIRGLGSSVLTWCVPQAHQAIGTVAASQASCRRRTGCWAVAVSKACAAGASGISVCLSPSGEGLTNACT